jgi:hypothetical protein
MAYNQAFYMGYNASQIFVFLYDNPKYFIIRVCLLLSWLLFMFFVKPDDGCIQPKPVAQQS